MVRGETPDQLLAGILDNLNGVLGTAWSEDEKKQTPAATQRVLDEQPDKVIIDENGRRALKMVAWIGIAKK